MEQLEKIIHEKIMYINENRQLQMKNVNKETINNPFLQVKFSKTNYILGGKNIEEYVETRVRS